MADNPTTGSAAGNATANNDGAAGNTPESENNPQLLTADMLNKAVGRLDIIVAKHFQGGADKLPDDAHHQAAPDAPYLGLRDSDDNGDFKLRDKISALDEYLATIPSMSADRAFLQDMMRTYDLSMENLAQEAQHYPLELRGAIATNAMLEKMMEEDPSITSNFDSEYLKKITETKTRFQAAVACQDKKIAEKSAPMEEDQSEAMED
ncbi:hypothetical protein N7509_002625 [Penicillium cosmopolitanum]|uniref:Uncharacterized protein n=1 Tax=Penicillium cosmopolitanum TaxID=1131564 RepID=A0A9W9W9F1_9EURO|nr:uncharacterized protein N7509_002625 [Penicillium cosmopolitanum]KAJ5408742.1 hypothetical protein N7509_002625 [Penicillium cosmopolitanum]